MNNKDRTQILVCGYPKSGTTWVTRLIGDALNSPTGGSVPSQDRKEPATEGQNRPGKFIVRKGHYKIINNAPLSLKSVPKAHQVYLPHLTDQERVIFLVRDPRDIAVSGAFYWGVPVGAFLNSMHKGTGGCRYLGNWGSYVSKWLDANINYYQICVIRYESLIKQPVNTLEYILETILGEIPTDRDRIDGAVRRNQFGTTVKRVTKKGDSLPLGKKANLKLLRKGIVGDYRNHFTEDMLNNCWKWFGNTMRRIGYQR